MLSDIMRVAGTHSFQGQVVEHDHRMSPKRFLRIYQSASVASQSGKVEGQGEGRGKLMPQQNSDGIKSNNEMGEGKTGCVGLPFD